MKMCERHWAALREAIISRRMGHLIAANGREAHARTAAAFAPGGRAEPADYEPLAGACLMIYGRAASLGLMAIEGCPVCELIATHPADCQHGCTAKDIELHWIDGPADGALEHATELGLMTTILSSEVANG